MANKSDNYYLRISSTICRVYGKTQSEGIRWIENQKKWISFLNISPMQLYGAGSTQYNDRMTRKKIPNKFLKNDAICTF